MFDNFGLERAPDLGYLHRPTQLTSGTMGVIVILILASIVMAGGFLAAFIWAVRSGQFDDTCTPSMRVLTEDVSAARLAAHPASETNVKPS